MQQELARRHSRADALEALLRSHPGRWFSLTELAHVGGIGGWRTRLSELSRLRDMRIEWNGKNGAASMHRFLPYEPLGRDAAMPTKQGSMF